MAINSLAEALAAGGGGGSTFARDDDPQLVREALPFSLKLIESVLAQTPEHRGLLLAAASGYTQYSYAFVQRDAELLEERDFAAANAARLRAAKLYLRARDFALRGLAVRYTDFASSLRQDPIAAVRRTKKDDVPLLYWLAASWGSAIASSKDDPDLIADQPIVEAAIDRCLELDPDFDDGAVYTFLIVYETVRQGAAGSAYERSGVFFDKAVKHSRGRLASPYVSYAQSVMIQTQDRARFEALLTQALDIDVDAVPERRLENILMQQRARWLLDRADDLFLPPLE